MDRKQLYKEITSLCLQDEVKAKYGKSYTQCSNNDLQEVINKAHRGLNKVHKNNSDVSYNLVCKLINILAKKRILLKSEVDEIIGA